MKEELEKHPEEPYKFNLHQQQFDNTKEKINEGTEILAETDRLERQKDDLIKERERQIRELDTLQRKVSELESVFVQTQNEWKEALLSDLAPGEEDRFVRQLEQMAHTSCQVLKEKARQKGTKEKGKEEISVRSL